VPFDPIFFAVAIPAVLLYGIAKGGFAGPLAILGVPLMSLVISPLQAAAILLPILCVQDLISIYSYRNSFHLKNLQILIPAAILGIFAGYLWFSLLSEQNIKIFLGLIAIIFSLNYFFFSDTLKKGSISFSKGTFWGAVSGFTSFGIHAGGLPFNIYMLPQKLDHRVYVGTAALFFGIVNFIKLYPYYLLDQLRIENITIALLLMPFAPIGFYIGYKLTQRIDGERFYSLTYACLLLIGLKLLNDGM
jgi:uncharacterized membrane protein YfcA|tara:strand:+ start:558 stop:1298 length:741 start_codon:yes stop_codon:yes gene_type:complete